MKLRQKGFKSRLSDGIEVINFERISDGLAPIDLVISYIIDVNPSRQDHMRLWN